MNIFPIDINIDAAIAETVQESIDLPIFKEYAWDFNINDFIYQNRKNIIVEGNDAIKIWIYKTLKTERYRFMAYTWDYGNEFNSLIGTRYSKEYVQSETERILKDCLLINHYILEINNVKAYVEGKILHIEFIAITVYGEVIINV